MSFPLFSKHITLSSILYSNSLAHTMRRSSLSLGLFGLAVARPSTSLDSEASAQHHMKRSCSVQDSKDSSECVPFSGAFFNGPSPSTKAAADVQVLEDAFHALAIMQTKYFDIDYGTWTTAIDWTSAFVGTAATGMLATLSTSLTEYDLGGVADFKAIETVVSTYYAQVIMSYFNQDILSIKGQVSHPCRYSELNLGADSRARHTMTCFGLCFSGSRAYNSWGPIPLSIIRGSRWTMQPQPRA